MAVTIRESSDVNLLPRVREILSAAFAQHDGRIDPPSGAHNETVASLAAKLETEHLLVAESERGIEGCIWCRRDGDDVYIGRLAVDPALQGQGIARELLEASIAWATDRGAKTMSLGVRVELTENVAFFKRHGFRITRADSHPGYSRPTNYHMERSLSLK